jgi:hypothetical protein
MPTKNGVLSSISYVDKQISFSGPETTIVGRSIVIHNNGTRVVCANLNVGGVAEGGNSAAAAEGGL